MELKAKVDQLSNQFGQLITEVEKVPVANHSDIFEQIIQKFIEKSMPMRLLLSFSYPRSKYQKI